MDVQRLSAYFYIYNRHITLMWENRKHRYFEKLAEIFDSVGHRTNKANTVSIACHPCHTLGGHSANSYGV